MNILNHDSDVEAVDFIAGATLLVDKPIEWTSFDVVNKIRWTLRNKLGVKKIKVGHAGTLDPMATGLLIICTGKNTKLINQFMGLDKGYTGEMTVGANTPTYDAESEVKETFNIDHLNDPMIIETGSSFIGEIPQIPPMFSALKIKGKALYKLARKGIEVKREPRTVTIHDLEVTDITLPKVQFKVTCSKGTYIRSLIYDWGKKMNSGAYLSRLRRISIGDYHVEHSFNLDDLINRLKVAS